MFKQKLIYGIFLSIIFSLNIGMLTAQSSETDHQPLQYNVEVNAQVIPIYAVDSKGNPVYDLKEDEIVLYINKKPYPLLEFLSYGITRNDGTLEDGESKQVQKSTSPERINFIILDGISNSKTGVRNSKRLAIDIVKSSGSGDSFVILKATPSLGLQYVIGPEKDKVLLLKELERIYMDPRWILMVPALAVSRTAVFEHAGAMKGLKNELPSTLSQMSYWENLATTTQYQSAVINFAKSLEDLKFAFKTIRLPKAVFLISSAFIQIGGDRKRYLQEPDYIQLYYENMRKAAIAFNKGGSLFFMLNPNIEVFPLYKRASKIMSDISNAKCIYARDLKDVVSNLKSNTAAYYEASFSVLPELGEDFRISVKCKRKGITLNTLQFGEKSKPYTLMEDLQKELFALNVITGGSWSRMAGTVKQINCDKIENLQGKKKKVKNVTFSLPKEFREKQIDIFILNLEPESLKTDFHKKSRKTDSQDYVQLEVEVQEKKKQYIVIIEPEKTACIFSQV